MAVESEELRVGRGFDRREQRVRVREHQWVMCDKPQTIGAQSLFTDGAGTGRKSAEFWIGT
jgi:hypothetical protein